jgi:hypothetical protein
MWSLLSAAAGRNGQCITAAGTSTTNGRPSVSASSAAHEPEVRIYMHPGRAPVGAVDLQRAREQFDLRRADAFRSLAEAEPACAGRVGFLLELNGRSCAHPEGEPESTVLFIENVRD